MDHAAVVLRCSSEIRKLVLSLYETLRHGGSFEYELNGGTRLLLSYTDYCRLVAQRKGSRSLTSVRL